MFYLFNAGFRSRNDEIEAFSYITLTIECIFAFDLILTFFKEYSPDHSNVSVRTFEQIKNNYLLDQFIYDLVPLIPL